MPGHAQRKGADAAKQQPGVEWAERPAGEHGDFPDPVQELRRAGQRPGGHVGVAVQVLGGAVPDQIDAEVDRPLIERCREGVVSQGQHAVRAGHGCDGAQVGDLQERVAR